MMMNKKEKESIDELISASESLNEKVVEGMAVYKRLTGILSVDCYIAEKSLWAKEMSYFGQLSDMAILTFCKTYKEPTKQLQWLSGMIGDYSTEENRKKLKKFLGKSYEKIFN